MFQYSWSLTNKPKFFCFLISWHKQINGETKVIELWRKRVKSPCDINVSWHISTMYPVIWWSRFWSLLVFQIYVVLKFQTKHKIARQLIYSLCSISINTRFWPFAVVKRNIKYLRPREFILAIINLVDLYDFIQYHTFSVFRNVL